MLVVLSDTHGCDSHRLEGRTRKAVMTADLVVHAGDFVTEQVLNAFLDVGDLRAVYGNNDEATVCERLPAERTVEWAGRRIAMVHGHEHARTALSLLARQEDADLVVVGHSHRPKIDAVGDIPVLNPGSHAAPRRYRPAHAELQWTGDGLDGRICEPDGTVIETFIL